MDLPRAAGDALAQPARARIFDLLVERRRALGTDEVSAELGLHPNGVRRHLERLREAGLVGRERSEGSRGRPRDLWSVAPGARPGGGPPGAYADLATWLARAIPVSHDRLSEVESVGEELGRELAPSGNGLEHGFRDALAALGFEPEVEPTEEGFCCRLGNCPFEETVRANQDVVCRLHRGITAGILAELAPEATLVRFEPHDPQTAGCLVEVADGRRGLAGP